MLKKKTPVKRTYRPLIGGEWIASENNAAGTIVNLIPEFPMTEPYRGNFQAVRISNDHINVLNTAHWDETDERSSESSGELLLRWFKISKVPGEEDKFKALPREKTVTVPHKSACQVQENGWLYLKMSRVSANGDVSFHDEVLGDVQLQFTLGYSTALPGDTNSSAVLPLAAATVNAEKEIEEIVQQQFGPGVLWVPDDVAGESSSSSEPPIEPPDEPDEPIEPEDSSSSENPDDPDNPIEPEDSSSSEIPDDPDVPITPEDSSSSEDPEKNITVILHYHENSTGDFAGTGVTTMQAEFTLTGTFTTQTSSPANGYMVRLSGTAYYDYGDGDTSSEEVIFDVNVFKNAERSCWDIYHVRVSDWAGFYQGQDTEYDTVFSTPVYKFPPLNSMPDYPVGTIQVEHHLIYGVSNEVPDNDLSSTLTITFTAN